MIVNDYKVLTIKDLMSLSEISETSAKRLKKKIIKELNLVKNEVLFIHYRQYYCF